MVSKLMPACELTDQLSARKASSISTNASTPCSCSSSLFDDTTYLGSSPEGDRRWTFSADGFSSNISEASGNSLDDVCVSLGTQMDSISLDASEGPRVVPGTCIRVWRKGSMQMEWADVIRCTGTTCPEDRTFKRQCDPEVDHLLCETLMFELFEFSPQRVAQGCDETVESYEIVHEDIQKTRWRAQEVARLHSALSEMGRLGNLLPVSRYQGRGFHASASQLCVKATVISGIAPKERQRVQDSIQQELMSSLLDCPQLSPTDSHGFDDGVEVHDAHITDSKQNPWQRLLHSVRGVFKPQPPSSANSAVQAPERQGDAADDICTSEEITAKHFPELCSQCISRGTWCRGPLHWHGVSALLDAAALVMYPSLQWSTCESGVEAEVVHKGYRVLLQIRPRLFFIPETDAKLFGEFADRLSIIEPMAMVKYTYYE